MNCYLRELEADDLRRRHEELSGRPCRPSGGDQQEQMQTRVDFWPLGGFLVDRGPFDEKARAQ